MCINLCLINKIATFLRRREPGFENGYDDYFFGSHIHTHYQSHNIYMYVLYISRGFNFFWTELNFLKHFFYKGEILYWPVDVDVYGGSLWGPRIPLGPPCKELSNGEAPGWWFRIPWSNVCCGDVLGDLRPSNSNKPFGPINRTPVLSTVNTNREKKIRILNYHSIFFKVIHL